MARFNASKFRSAVNKAVSQYNSAVRQHNANVRRAVAEHNRRVSRYNSQVRELQRQLSSLRQRPGVRIFAQLEVELRHVVAHREPTFVVRENEWNTLAGSEQSRISEAARDEGVDLMLVDEDGDEV